MGKAFAAQKTFIFSMQIVGLPIRQLTLSHKYFQTGFRPAHGLAHRRTEVSGNLNELICGSWVLLTSHSTPHLACAWRESGVHAPAARVLNGRLSDTALRARYCLCC